MESLPTNNGSIKGANLSYLYCQLISHLSGSHLELPRVYDYMGNQLAFRNSSVVWADWTGNSAENSEEPHY